ncbi:ribulose-5-phosphate 4-epimerase/fuculose-1-phosphate aldolase [Rahnella sp. BIGb0603]|jgi:ribulose-5-phosphate 4-epimerase/fuculose-1-phosphate aldolase|uniref:3-oxo-tetronate 4-phosphate decarboxylase n=1 Tax=unclassified Rahnella TaxID=2635087 RepID=UPI001AD87A8A|nr:MULTISPECIES: aldolase [unclassified Rahnella]MCS3422847.1 ribulose-5-phosphate 4-epimerase/fuculose-1-phosphate aldolase [Rahnella sp. BIGb0603]
MKSENKIREDICFAGESLFQRGYTVGSSGNISARLDDGWLITPTDACLGNLDPAKIAKVNLQGEWINGEKPSKTLKLHQGIYQNNPDAQCVTHTHSTYLVLLTLRGVWSPEAILPPITPYQVMKVGKIPLINYHRPGAQEVAERVATLANHVKGVMLERLGPVVWGHSVAHASYILEELEETAKLWLKSERKVIALPDEAINELCALFGCHW